MKLSFSTLGCPNWDLGTIISKAVEYGFDGIEMRGVNQELDVTKLPEFTTNAKETKQRLMDSGIEICCFSSSVMMSDPNPANIDKSLDELSRYARLCEIYDTPNIRIFGGIIGKLSWEQAIDNASSTLEKMITVIENFNAKIVVETHDDWMNADHFKELMERVNSESVGILWDVNHPFMFIGEEPELTWQEAGKWIYHTHWKDSKINHKTKHGFEPCLMRDGVLPLKNIYNTLKNGGYNGYLSLEWEKRWHPEIPGPEIAFPQYIKIMKEMIQS